MKKILFVITSNKKPGHSWKNTGFWIEELAAPYYALKDADFDITLASPKDGKPLIDPISETINAQTKATKCFDLDKKANTLLAITHQLSEVNENDFDAIFYPDEHGVLWDLVENKISIKLIENFSANKKPVAFVCHASADLKHTKGIKGKSF